MNSVRPYKAKDAQRVRQICMDNADFDVSDESARKYLMLMYCDYYIQEEPFNCFVAVNDKDEAIGYILCAENYDAYAKVFNEKYLPLAAALGAKKYVDAKLDMLSHAMFKSQYPAHMHIDIDLGWQRLGLGSMLVSTLKAHLRQKELGGVMLVVAPDNQAAIDFYNKNGFKNLLNTRFGKAMALDFDSKE